MNYSTYIIAEIGFNLEGCVSKCIKMVKNAKETGANAIKLQTIDPELNYASDTLSYKLFKKALLSKEQTEKVFIFAKSLGLDVFTTVGDIQTAQWVSKLRPTAWKISSSMLTHIPLIKYFSKDKKQIFISTGLAKEKEVSGVVKILKSRKCNFSLLHCTSIYPAKLSELNLHKINLYKHKYKVKVGYSDHSKGDFAACLAVASGAEIIEKHITYDNKRESFDHKVSLNTKQMKIFIDKIRMVERIFNNNNESLEKLIDQNRKKFLRVIVANEDIKKGTKFSSKNIAIKRVNDNTNGIVPEFYYKLLNKYAKIDLKKDHKILYDYISLK